LIGEGRIGELSACGVDDGQPPPFTVTDGEVPVVRTPGEFWVDGRGLDGEPLVAGLQMPDLDAACTLRPHDGGESTGGIDGEPFDVVRGRQRFAGA
jgi:hypothetical protein